MLSLFPELLFLAPLSAVLIRVATAYAFAYIASKRLGAPSTTRGLGIVEGLAAALLFLGLYTQAGAILGALLGFIYIFFPRLAILPKSTAILLVVMCISLLVTGPGPFTMTLGDMAIPVSFDLPL